MRGGRATERGCGEERLEGDRWGERERDRARMGDSLTGLFARVTTPNY